MKKFVSLLTAVMLTIQTLSSATSIVQAAESPQSTTSAEIAAALQDLGLTALLDQIADYGGVFDASTFTLADIQGLEDLVNALVSEYSAELTDALDEVINDLLSQLGGGDAGAGEQLTAALQSIFATTLTELQSLNTTELRAHIEEKIQEIAPKIISGELSAVEAKAEVSKEIEKTMETLADKVYIYAYNEIKSQTLASLGNDSQALLDLLGQQNLNSEDLSTALNALSALAAFNANKETLKAELIAALQAQDKDCSDSTLFPTETEQNACQDAKNAYQTVQNQIDTASGAVNAAAAIVKSTSIALSCVKGEKDENNKVVGGTYTGEPCPTDNNALTTALDTIDATAAGIKAGLDGLETLLGISEDDDFDTKKTEAAQEVTILQAEINQIKASDEYKKLQEELVALEVEKAKIISENADLQAKIEALDTQITNLQQEIDTINAGGKVCRNIVGNKCSDENKCGFFSNSSCKDTVKIAVQ
ncbi:MAG: hypothetical protein LBG52_05260 [Candidatus Peribacteria bacterium]|jgi:predicted nuclease with TOPRIM domain|nr:hypothetical protein [Candidatus Peribacteria bacterium]